jgi:L-alanine-DL-glutamate epimerase-like enolase superfamily enzyme
MKITSVTTMAVTLPLPPRDYPGEKAGTKREWGRLSRITPHRPKPVLDYVIVKVATDNGIVGLGEATPDIGFFGETLEEVKSAIDRYFGPRLVGMDPFDREAILYQLDFRGNWCARSAVDLAVHDLLGKALGIPVYQLIGGRCRDRVLVALEIGGGPPQEMAKKCAGFVKQGVRAFKPKIGGVPEADAERLKAIREAVGKDVVIRADANQGYTPKEAIRLCRLAERYDVGLELLEQPVGYQDLHGMAEVRAAVDTLIEADESCYGIQDAMNIIRAGAADVLNIKVEKVGGLYNAKKVAALAEAAGLQCVVGTAFGTGITDAAKLHLAASTMTIKDAVEFTEIYLHENLLMAPHDRELRLPLAADGCLAVPQGPGFGVTLDEERARGFTSTTTS